MVSLSSIFTHCFSNSYSPSSGTRQQLPSAQALPASGVEYWLQSCRAHGFSEQYAKCTLKNNSRKTLITYLKCWRKFANWYHKWKTNYSAITVNDVSDFLIFLFNSKNNSGNNYSVDTINTYRSAIAYFVQFDIPNLGFDVAILRLFQSFHQQRPSLPRYLVTWDVGIVLKFFASWHPPSALSLKKLTLKTVVLIALTSSDRAQTIHALRVDKVVSTPQGLEFVIFDRLKTSRRGQPAKIVKCVSWDAQELDVSFYVQKYMERTLTKRNNAYIRGLGKPTQLFLSYKTGLPVCKSTISRWIKEGMRLAGIDVSHFKSHSTRGASVSAARKKGASIPQILKTGDWSNLGTYQRFYERPCEDTPVGQIILEGAL